MERPKLDTLFLAYRTSGDATALAQVFDLAAPELYELARRLSPDRSAAEDVLQDTFVTAIEKRASWDEREPLLPWLIGILAIASQRRRRERARTPDPKQVVQAEVERPEAALAQRELRAELDATLSALNSEERSLVEQRLIEGRTPRDMARERGLSATTLRMRLSRAIARLRRAAPSSLSWALMPWNSRRALHNVRLRVLPNAAPTVAPLAFASAMLGIAAVAGAVGMMADRSPEKPAVHATTVGPGPPVRSEGSQPPAMLGSTSVAKGAQANEGATDASHRIAVIGPAPLFTVGVPPAEFDFVAPPIPVDAPRKRLHLVVLRGGQPFADAVVLRIFPDVGLSGGTRTDQFGRCDLDIVIQANIQFCIRGRACRIAYFDVDPEQLQNGAERTIALEPGPEPVSVTFHAAWTFPQWFEVMFVPVDGLNGARPGFEELLEKFRKAVNGPETERARVLADGSLSNPIAPGHYWVVAMQGSIVSPAPPDLLTCCFELRIPEGQYFECDYPGSVGGSIVLDVLGQQTTDAYVNVWIQDGEEDPRVLSFRIYGNTVSSAIDVGTSNARSEPIPAGEHELMITQRGKEIERRRVQIVRGEELQLSISP